MRKSIALLCVFVAFVMAFCACTPAAVEQQPAGKEPGSVILSIVLRKISFMLNRLDDRRPGWAFPVKDAQHLSCP